MAALAGTGVFSWRSNHLSISNPAASTRPGAACIRACVRAEEVVAEKEDVNRRLVLAGTCAMAASLILTRSSSAEEKIPDRYRAFVDRIDGYSYYYPMDWRDFDFLGHDSAFKDRNVSLQNVRVGFVPTDKTDIRDMGPMEEVIPDLIKNYYASPNQRPIIFNMQEKTVDGKNYWTFEYELTSNNFSRTAFATVGIGNGRYYTLVVGANERRWKRVRGKLKVVADSFKILDL